jgi:hypothetical protein
MVYKRFLLVVTALLLTCGLFFANNLPTSWLARPVRAASSAIHLVRSDQTTAIIEIQAPPLDLSYQDTASGRCQVIQLEGYSASSVSGAPDLPSAGLMLGIPFGAEPGIRVIEADETLVPAIVDLCPVAQPIFNNVAGRLVWQAETIQPDSAIYSSNAWYPAQPVAIDSIGMIRSQRVLQIRLQPIQYNPVTKQLNIYTRLVLEVDYSSAGRQPLGGQHPPIPEGDFESVLAQSLLNYEQAKAWRSQPSTVSPPLEDSHAASQAAYKISVVQDGIYQLSYIALKNAGVPVDSLDPRTLRLSNQGIEVATFVSGEADSVFNPNDYLLFYGQKVNTRYTSENVYWLSWGAGSGQRMASLDGSPTPGYEVLAHFLTTQRVEIDADYYIDHPSGPQKDHWYGSLIYAASSPASQDFQFQLTHLETQDLPAKVRGLLKGYAASPNHHTRIYINGRLIEDASWQAKSEHPFEIIVPQSYLVEGANTIRVECPRDGKITLDGVLVNWFEIDYHRTYQVDNDGLAFDGETLGGVEFRLDGFSSQVVDIFDITNPLQPAIIVGAVFQSGSSGYLAQFQQQLNLERHYLALGNTKRLTPISIVADTPSNLHSTTNGADYLIITHNNFINDIQPLAAWRAHGWRVNVVDVQDVYDEFNGGVFSPQAIRDFLTYAYASWTPPALSYVLLVGDGNFDYKNNYGWGEPNYIPPFLDDVDPWIGETATDNRYASVSGADLLPDLFIGRFPVQTIPQVQAMVSNVLNYEQAIPTGGWNTRLAFVADNTDSAGNFAAGSNLVADHLVPSGYSVEKIYYLVTHPSLSSARTAIQNAFQQGRLIISYNGHSGIDLWASEGLLKDTDISSLTSGLQQPFLAPMTCQEGYFIWPKPPGNDYSALAESIVRVAGKGAIASFSPTGWGLSSGHDYLNKGLYRAIFEQDQTRIGAAVTLAKYYLYTQTAAHRELIETYVLLGDPALKLHTIPKGLNIYLPIVVR